MTDTRPLGHAYGAGWLADTEPAALQSVPNHDTVDAEHAGSGGQQWRWLDEPRPAPAPDPAPPGRGTRRLWPALAAALVTAAAITGIGIRSVTNHTDTAAVIPTVTATTPASTTTTTTNPACAGLSGTLVTDAVGDPSTQPGVIAAFEHAYYRLRDARAALALVAPDAGLAEDALTTGIASIPPGTAHCVAITPIAETAAEVHLVQLGPDGARVDYLQLINTSRAPDGQHRITHFQARG